MKREYDLANAVRGKFYRPELDLVPPVHLEPRIRDWLASHARSQGTTLSELVNELLRKDIERIDAAK